MDITEVDYTGGACRALGRAVSAVDADRLSRDRSHNLYGSVIQSPIGCEDRPASCSRPATAPPRRTGSRREALMYGSTYASSANAEVVQPARVSHRRRCDAAARHAGSSRFHGFASAQRLADYPFTLGVASGDPTPDGVVLWTRLAPKPLEGGGMPSHPIGVEWTVASDERMQRIVQRGAVLAVPELGHSVHVEVDGLEPSRWYWYQFKVGSEVSQIGRTRTAPPVGSTEDLRFAFVSCQHYAQGFYYAYRHLAHERSRFRRASRRLHLRGAGNERHPAPALAGARDHIDRGLSHPVRAYKSDPDLQAAHAAFPWIVTWDDHETENDYAGFIPENPADPADNQPDFASRRARAYQAYYEHMPLRAAQLPFGPSLSSIDVWASDVSSP